MFLQCRLDKKLNVNIILGLLVFCIKENKNIITFEQYYKLIDIYDNFINKMYVVGEIVAEMIMAHVCLYTHKRIDNTHL